MTQFTASKGDKEVGRVKFNSFKTDEAIKITMRVRQDEYSEVKCIEKCTEAVRENEGQLECL